MILVRIKKKINLNVSYYFFFLRNNTGNKVDTNTDKECVLGDLYLGVALLYKKLKQMKIKCFQIDQEVLGKTKFKKLKIPNANKLRKPIYFFF